MANGPPVFTIIFLSLLLLDFSYSLGLDELTVTTIDGKMHALEGYTCHDGFSSGMKTLFDEKIKNGLSSLLRLPSKEFGNILQNLSHLQYAFLQLINTLSSNDSTYSSILLELLSSMDLKHSEVITPFFLSKLNFNSDLIYNVSKRLAETNNGGSVRISEDIGKEFLKLENKYGLFDVACLKGDINLLEWYILQGYDIIAHGSKCFQIAWDSSQWQIVKILIEKGFLLNTVSDKLARLTVKKVTLLHFVAETHSPFSVFSLTKAGLDVNSVDENGCSPLCRALITDNIPVMNALLVNGANVNMITNFGESLLHIAVLNSNPVAVEALVNSGVDTGVVNKDGLTPLQCSEQIELTNVVAILHESGVRIAERNATESLWYFWVSAINNKPSESTLEPYFSARLPNNRSGTSKVLGNQLKIAKVLSSEDSRNSSRFNGLKSELLNIAATSGNSELIEYLMIAQPISELVMNQSQLLLDAVTKGYIELVNLLIKKGFDINVADSKNETALLKATSKGYEDIVYLLLQNRADPNSGTDKGWTPLMEAVLNSEHKIITRLLQNGANINATDKSGRTALHVAVSTRDTNSINILLESNSVVEKDDIAGVTPLQLAAETGGMQVFLLLVHKGADINHKKYDGQAILQTAVEAGQIDITDYLISQGADVNSKALNGWSVLHSAVKSNNVELLKKIIKAGSDVNVTNNDGISVLHVAAEAASLPILEILLKEGANPNAQSSSGWSVLHAAAESGNLRIIKKLLDAGAALKSATNQDGWTVLHEAVSNNKTDLVKLFIEKGADPNSKSKQGWSVLHTAVEKRNIGMIKVLLDSGANVNAATESGWSVLHAASEATPEVVKVLLDNGANPGLKTTTGWSVLHAAVSKGNLPIISLLLDGPAIDVNSRNNEGWSVLQEAVSSNSPQVVSMLLKKGANPDTGTKSGWTVLHGAAEKGYIEIMELLIKHKADVNRSLTDSSWPPLFTAAESGQLSAVKLLVSSGAQKSDYQTAADIAKKNNHKDISDWLELMKNS